MTVLFIRHSDDSNESSEYVHDPRITKKGEEKAYRIAIDLVRKYGKPDIIFCSPFQRTIQTAKRMKKMCGYDTTIYIDNNLSRYFCSREKKDPKITPSTKKYDAPILECWDEFEHRIDSHLKMIKKKGYIRHNDEMIWCITHALVYKHVARTYGIHIPVVIPFMHHFILNEWSKELSKEQRRKNKRKEHKKKRIKF